LFVKLVKLWTDDLTAQFASASTTNALRACLKNGSRRREEAEKRAILARNPAPHVGGYPAHAISKHALSSSKAHEKRSAMRRNSTRQAIARFDRFTWGAAHTTISAIADSSNPFGGLTTPFHLQHAHLSFVAAISSKAQHSFRLEGRLGLSSISYQPCDAKDEVRPSNSRDMGMYGSQSTKAQSYKQRSSYLTKLGVPLECRSASGRGTQCRQPPRRPQQSRIRA